MSRKFTFVFFALSVLASLAYANDWSFGMKGGLNFANVSVSPSDPGVSYGSRTCYGAGFMVNKNLDSLWDLRTDILYLQKGSSAKYHFDFYGYDIGYSDHIKLEYLTIAPLFIYKIADLDDKDYTGKPSTAFVEFGPEVSFIASAKNDAGNYLAGMKNEDFDINVGGGLKLPVGNAHLLPEIRYSFGLTNISRDSQYSVKTNGVQFFLGDLF